jgi:hypothetical protein
MGNAEVEATSIVLDGDFERAGRVQADGQLSGAGA